MNTNATEFLSCTRKSELIPKATIDEWQANNERLMTDGDARDVAEALISAALLTEWQALKLLDGKWKGFFLDHYVIRDWHHVDDDAGLSFFSAFCTRTGDSVLLECVPKSKGTRPNGTIRYRAIPSDTG